MSLFRKLYYTNSKEKQFYFSLLALTVAGISWWLLNGWLDTKVTICPMKAVTGIPCPACGSTRSLWALMRGEIISSILLNPLGIVLATILLLLIAGLIFYFFFKNNFLYIFYIQVENKLKKPAVYIPFFLLIFSNWIWNIIKQI